MKKEGKKILIIAIAAIAVILIILFLKPLKVETTRVVTNFEECVAAGYPVMESYPRQCSVNGKTFIEEIDTIETNLEDYFVEQLWQKGSENLGAMPIEGFNPDLYKGAFPLLENYDFHNTEAYGGIWKYENDELIFERNESEPITSADGTLTNEGVKQLYNNLKIRMDFVIESKEDIDSFVNFLSGENGEQKIYCTPESRNAESCIEIYSPVCGYVQVECITTPCNPVPETFSNSCFACMNERVEYYLDGKCS